MCTVVSSRIGKRAFLVQAAVCVLIASLPATANAAMFVFDLDQPGGPDGKELIASATVDVQPSQVVVTLTNGTVNPRSVAEALTGVSFTGVDTPGLYIISENASFIEIHGNTAADVEAVAVPGNFLPDGTNTGKWRVSDEGFGNGVTLNWHAGSSAAIIGPALNGAYSDSNASLQGNHNPFIDQTATFTLNRPQGFPQTISSLTFYFNTSMDVVKHTTPTPEPSTIAFLASTGLWFIRRRYA